MRALYAAALGRARRTAPTNLRPRESPGSARRDHRATRTRKAEVDVKTQRLVEEMLERNAIAHDDLVSIIFTATDDITAEFPATAARALGLGDVPLLCARELGDRPRHAARDPGADALLRRPAAQRAPPRVPRGRAHAPRRPPGLTVAGRVAVVGTGLIGGSVGLALARAGLRRRRVRPRRRRGRARPSSSARSARSRGTIDDAVAGADLVVVAVPVGAIAAVVIAALDAGAAVVTDVGSVKAPVVAEVERARPDASARFVGGHPMAGSEQDGVDGADATLFVGSTWVLTPTANTDERAYTLGAAASSAISAPTSSTVTPAHHDELVALVSHVPAARGLHADGRRERERGRPADDAAARGRRVPRHDAHRGRAPGHLARHPDRRTATRCSSRSTPTSRRCCAPGRSSRPVHREDLLALLERARAARRNLPVGVAMATKLVELRVPVPDRPGVLAEVTTLAGRLGVNVADVEIAHSLEGGRGVIVLVVAAIDADAYEAGLRDLGYHVSRTDLA